MDCEEYMSLLKDVDSILLVESDRCGAAVLIKWCTSTVDQILQVQGGGSDFTEVMYERLRITDISLRLNVLV